jgi:hypothetical protein
MTDATLPITSPLDVFKDLLTTYPALAGLVAELAPYAPALTRMVQAEISDLIENIQCKDWYAADLVLSNKMTEAEMVALTSEGRERITALIAKTAADAALLKEVLLRAVIALVTTGVTLL